MAPSHPEVARRWTLRAQSYASVWLFCLAMNLLKRSPGEGFVSPQGLPSSLSPFFLSQSSPPAPVAPMALGFCSRKQCRGGGLGGAPATLKRGIGQGLLPTGARSQGEEERGRGPPTCSHSSPSQAAFLPALVAWSPERNVPFGAWLSLAKAWVHHPVSSVLPLYSPSSW